MNSNTTHIGLQPSTHTGQAATPPPGPSLHAACAHHGLVPSLLGVGKNVFQGPDNNNNPISSAVTHFRVIGLPLFATHL